jgi:RNA polymerase sigma factor (sigma-70 family)
MLRPPGRSGATHSIEAIRSIRRQSTASSAGARFLDSLPRTVTLDSELLERWNAGDADAGEELFERHFDAIYRFFHTKSPQHCEDLVQRTFAACIAKRTRLRDATSFKAFLYGIARIELLQSFRLRAREDREINLGEDSVFDLDPSPSRIAASKQEQQLLLDALRRIPVDLQIVIELHYWENMSTAEIAQVVEVPQGTVKSRLRRAREAIVEALQTTANDKKLLESTLVGFEGWVDDIKALLGGRSSPEPQ